MTLQFATSKYPLPFSLRLRFGIRHILDSILRFALGIYRDKSSQEGIFTALLAREDANINRICFSYANSAIEFEDLRQDAIINIWRGMKSFRGESSESTWVYRVTINSCLSTIRKQSRHKHEDLEQLYSLIDAEDEEREAIEQMHNIISSLGREEKAIIMMWLDEMSYNDIATAMGMNRNTVATKIRRIKEIIAKQYHKEEKI